MIALFNSGETAGDDDLAAADDGCQQHLPAQLQILQGDAQHLAGRGGGGEAEGFHMTAQHLVKALHLAALGVAQCAAVAGDLIGHDVLGGDDGVDTRRGHQLHIVGACHLRQHLGHTVALGVHGHQQVILIAVGDGHKGIGIEDALLLQQGVVRAIAQDDHRLRDLGGEDTAALGIFFHNTHAAARVLQFPRQIHGGAAAAEDGHVLHLVPRSAHVAQHLLQLFVAAYHVEVVAAGGNIFAVGDEILAIALGGAEQHLGLTLTLLFQRLTANDILLCQLHADHGDQTAGKRLSDEGGGEGENVGDLTGGGKVGVDDHVEADLPLQHLSVAAIVCVTDTGHRVAGTQLLGDEAAHQIRLIVVGDSNHQIGVSCACVDEDGDGRAVALETHDVQRAFAAAQGGGAAVHDGDVVSLLREGLGNGEANFTVANNNNFHNVLLFQRIGRKNLLR